ncbi:MAG: Maf family protein [Vicinamibacterales bacterium]
MILASASPRRAELLTAAGYAFEVLAVDVDERLRPGEAPLAYVQRLAEGKSARALELLTAGDGYIVLAADTAVVVGEQILGKPRDAEDAARMLRLLAGRVHVVLTGVSARSAAQELVIVERTVVEFAQLTEDQIAWYVSSGEGSDKAGAYGIQGLASRFIPRIEGSYSNVVGLPIAAVDHLIQRLTRPPRALASPG